MAKNLFPVIIQEYESKEILMLGYVNRLALQKTRQTGYVYFWSRSRNMLWLKGETSGNKLKIKNIFIDCDKDTYLFQVKLIGQNICHTNKKSCFYQKI